MAKEMTYRDAGVDIEAADQALRTVKELVKEAQGKEVLTGIGAFGGLFQPDLTGFKDPVLVSSVDSIGTKVLLARAAEQYRNLGFDIVNHCVNDIAVMGATPLFFLDYLAFGRFKSETMVQIMSGLVEACRANEVSLVGGETAEMPDLYKVGDFDIAGFVVGLVDRAKIIDGKSIKAGDQIIGLSSNGLHTNGFTLVRKIFFSQDYDRISEKCGPGNETLGEALLRPHLAYSPLLKALRKFQLKGLAHVTGGGIEDNLARILTDQVQARIRWGSWEIPDIFQFIQQQGNVTLAEMRHVFNMGLGLIIIANHHETEEILKVITAQNYSGLVIGEIGPGQGEVTFV